MTSASELFHNRRSRHNRVAFAASDSSTGDLGLGLDHLHFSHHHRRQNQSHHSHRHDLDGCDPLRRSPHVRHHRYSNSERPSLTLDQGNRQFAPSNSRNTEPPRNIRRPGIPASDRLPGSVLLARERLLERLRGVSLSGNRRSSRDSSSMTGNEQTFNDHWRLADASDWGTEISGQFSSSGSHLSSSTLSPDRTISMTLKKPPGLSHESLNRLHVEIFSSEEGCEGSEDCSICLESFVEGDKLICLPCEHRFHSGCLDPWVRTCGDCPYCRKAIMVPARETS